MNPACQMQRTSPRCERHNNVQQYAGASAGTTAEPHLRDGCVVLVPCASSDGCWRKAFGVRAGKLRVQRASTRCERHDNGLRCAVVGAGVPHQVGCNAMPVPVSYTHLTLPTKA